MVILNGESAILKKRAFREIAVLKECLPIPPVYRPSLEPLHVVKGGKNKNGKSLRMSFEAKQKNLCLAAAN